LTSAQNPDELFDVVTFRGEPTGVRKRRADVHRDGDWHRAIHLWVIGERDGQGFLLFQRRSLAKDTSPGKIDPTVGGHLGAGETWRDALREAEEEIGIPITERDVVHVGTRRGVNEAEAGVVDREIQDVFFARNDAPLSDYRPNPAELSALLRIEIDDALELFGGYQESAAVDVLDASTLEVGTGRVDRTDFASLFDRYVYRVAIAARSFLVGERHFSV
jgi:isopentenyldiphosphate isomerase